MPFALVSMEWNSTDLTPATLHDGQDRFGLANRQHRPRNGKFTFTLSVGRGSHTELWILSDLQSAKGINPRSVFSEGLAIDYKWFDKHDIAPGFEFGHGLRWANLNHKRR